jgi:hypothetical protein
MISGTLGAQSAEYKGPASVHRYPHGSHKCQRDGESAAVEISVYKLFRAVFVTSVSLSLFLSLSLSLNAGGTGHTLACFDRLPGTSMPASKGPG